MLGPLFVEESYQRIDGFADKALAAWQAHKKPGLAERTLTKKRNGLGTPVYFWKTGRLC